MTLHKRLFRVKLNMTGFFLLFLSFSVHGQFLRTSYFMEGTPYRMKLNPALTPTRGYFNIPIVGVLNAAASSNSFGVQDISDILDDEGDFYHNPKFLNRLTDDNRLNVMFNTDAISFGFYQGPNFWSFNAGMRIDIGANIPKTMFDFIHEVDHPDYVWERTTCDIEREKLSVIAYSEIGIGYARALNKRLTIGGKAKVLLGLGDLQLNVDRIKVDTYLPENWEDVTPANIDDYHAKMDIDARMESSFKGMELSKSEDGYIDDFDFKEYGIGGYGGAFDLGISYRLSDGLEMSAAVLDVGFISWSKKSTTKAIATGSMNYEAKDYPKNEEGLALFQADVQDFTDRLSEGELLNYDMFQLKEEEGEARKTSLYPTVVLGAEYSLAGNWLTAGALSTTRFMQPETMSELTLSVNVCPKNWFNIAVAYSVVNNGLGTALKLGPFFAGADYVPLKGNPKNGDVFFGISIPLSKKKSEWWL